MEIYPCAFRCFMHSPVLLKRFTKVHFMAEADVLEI